MKRVIFLCGVLLTVCTPSFPQLRPVHTFSIVARDPATGQMGVAVQSHWFSVGSIVTWAEAGVGAVATQSFVDPSYGPNGLELMRNGTAAPVALKQLLARDRQSSVRQVAFVDSQGRVGVWTGAKNMQAAGHFAGHPGGERYWRMVIDEAARQSQFANGEEKNPDGTLTTGGIFSTEANLMANSKIWPAMADAFMKAGGDLADRLLAALDAAQSVGGDIRGKQSAALIVVEGKRQPAAWMGRIFDLRVDDAPEPLKELRRLVSLQRAYNHMNAGDLATERRDAEGALREYAAAEAIASKTAGVLPSRLAEMFYWHAVALVNMNRVEESLPLFRRAFAIEKGWIELTPRLPGSGLLPDDSGLIARIVAQGKPSGRR
jgi:uncharacterized Ntn-hydrolase superfamily protein